MKFWKISRKSSNFVNFQARKKFFFLHRSEFCHKKIGAVISTLKAAILPQGGAVFVNFYVSTDMIAWWVSVHWALELKVGITWDHNIRSLPVWLLFLFWRVTNCPLMSAFLGLNIVRYCGKVLSSWMYFHLFWGIWQWILNKQRY